MKDIIYMRVNIDSRVDQNKTRLKNGKFFDNLMKLSPLAKKLDIETYRNPKSASLNVLNKRGGVL